MDFDDDDDDDFVDTKAKKTTTNSSRKSSRAKSSQNEIDEIFGSPSPMSRLKNARRSNKENLLDGGDCHSQIWNDFDLPHRAALPSTRPVQQLFSEDEDLDDIPLVNTLGWGNVEQEQEEDEVINLESDFDDYEAPLDNLERDVLTQQLRSDWEEEEGDLAAEENLDLAGDDLELEDSEEEVFGPSPMKQPPVRPSRLSLGGAGIVMPREELDSDDPQLLILVQQAVDIRKKLFKNKNFHKNISKLITEEAMSLHEDYQALKQLVLDIFEVLPFQKLSSVSESLCRDLDLIKQCLSKLKKRLLEFEENQQNPAPVRICKEKEYNDGSPPFDDLRGMESGKTRLKIKSK